jgi:hypothetical protein
MAERNLYQAMRAVSTPTGKGRVEDPAQHSYRQKIDQFRESSRVTGSFLSRANVDVAQLRTAAGYRILELGARRRLVRVLRDLRVAIRSAIIHFQYVLMLFLAGTLTTERQTG